MTKYSYSAVDSNGIPQSGLVEANSTDQAVQVLRNRGLIVTEVKEKKELELGQIIGKFRGVPAQEKIVFTRQLSTMIASGLPITQSLKILQQQAHNAVFEQSLGDILRAIDGGASLHEAMAEHPKVFNRLYLSLIKAGEASGQLDVILDRLAEMMEKDKEFKDKVRGAMIYPIIIVVVMLMVLAVMFLFVIPRLAALYEELNAELPVITKLMISASKLMVGFWWLAALLTVGAFVGLRYLLRRPNVREVTDELKLKLPVFGSLSREVQLTSFTRTLSMLVSSGIPLLEALSIAKETITNQIFRDGVNAAAAAVGKGRPLGETFRANQAFPPIMSEMITAGEQTGKLDEVLGKVSQYFENEATNKTENLASAIEPIVMVVLGVMVGFLVVSLILPIYSLTSQF